MCSILAVFAWQGVGVDVNSEGRDGCMSNNYPLSLWPMVHRDERARFFPSMRAPPLHADTRGAEVRDGFYSVRGTMKF